MMHTVISGSDDGRGGKSNGNGDGDGEPAGGSSCGGDGIGSRSRGVPGVGKIVMDIVGGGDGGGG